MKKAFKIILIIFAVILAVFVIAAMGISVYTGHQVTVNSNQMASTDGSKRIPEQLFERMGFDYEGFTVKYETESFTLTSTLEGHLIPVDYIRCKKGSDSGRTVVMVHGLGGNKYTVYPVAECFLENGWDVLAYDQRSSGENTAPYNTYGYFEKYDLIDCINYVMERSPGGRVGLWGASFGGATVCAALGYNDTADKVEFAVLDCPLGSMEQEIRMYLDENDMGIPTDYMIMCGRIMNWIEMGYSYDDVDAARNISKADVPLLVFNSKSDTVTPYEMGRDIYEASPCVNKTIVTVEDSEHTEIWEDHNRQYRDAVKKLLGSAEK